MRDPNGAWDGNWLNWVCMRKIDVTRKVLMGGLATARTGGGNQTLYGESPTGHAFLKEYDGTGVSPYDGHYYFGIADGYIYVDSDNYPYDGTKYTISVKKDINYEPQDFLDGNLSGVLQRVGDKAFWGNTWFDTGTGKDGSGGFIAAPIGTNMTSLVTDLQNTAADTWTPLAESFYVASQYFKQEAVEDGLDYQNGVTGPFNDVNDPYYHDQEVWCAKSFVLLLTDGASTMDGMIPSRSQGLCRWKGNVSERRRGRL